MRIIIPSRRRPQNVARMNALFPRALWCVDRQDFRDYKLHKNQALIHPDDVLGPAKKKQWVLDHVDDEVVFLVDDDIKFLFCNVGLVGRRITEPESIQRILDNTLELARGFQTPLFGYAKHADVRKYNPSKPFNLATWVSTAMGIVGRPVRFTDRMVARADVDLSLRVLEKFRIVLSDERFAFASDRFTNTGGAATVRTQASDRSDLLYLKREWGPYVSFKETQRGITPTIHVERTIPLQL